VLEEAHDTEEIIQRSRRWISARRSWCAVCGCQARSSRASGREEVKSYQTMTRSLLVLADRLGELGVTRVVMEATSDYVRREGA
jgi:transposase